MGTRAKHNGHIQQEVEGYLQHKSLVYMGLDPKIYGPLALIISEPPGFRRGLHKHSHQQLILPTSCVTFGTRCLTASISPIRRHHSPLQVQSPLTTNAKALFSSLQWLIPPHRMAFTSTFCAPPQLTYILFALYLRNSHHFHHH